MCRLSQATGERPDVDGLVALLVHCVGGSGCGGADNRAGSQCSQLCLVEGAPGKLCMLCVESQGARHGRDPGDQRARDRDEGSTRRAGAHVAASNSSFPTSGQACGRVLVRHAARRGAASGRHHKGDEDEEHQERRHDGRGPQGTAWIPHAVITAAADEGERCATKESEGLSQNGYG